MPSIASSNPVSTTEACLAVEDFLCSVATSLWDAFWSSDDEEFPFFVTDVQKLSSRHNLPHCLALVKRHDKREDDVLWEHISEIVLLEGSLQGPTYESFPTSFQVSQAVFCALHLLVSRKLSHVRLSTSANQNVFTVFVLLVHFHGGSVIRIEGDISSLEADTVEVYKSAAVWVQKQASLMVSAVNKVWTTFGTVNWRDVGALQMLLATFYCIEQFRAPKKSILDLYSKQIFFSSQKVEQRRQEINGNNKNFAVALVSEIYEDSEDILEVDHRNTLTFPTFLKIEPGSLLWIEDTDRKKMLEVYDVCVSAEHHVCIGVDVDDEAKRPVNIFVGAHPAQLETSWEEMGAWYHVQRLTRILTTMKQRGLQTRHIPRLVHSGVLLHPGMCEKRESQAHCDHPWCQVPVLVTSPVGESLQQIFLRDKVLPPIELLRCCHDCLSAVQSAHSMGIQHANITPDNIIRVAEANGENYYVLVEWGHAVLEENDRPKVNLIFSSTDALQSGRLCPASDIESLLYVLFYLSRGKLPQCVSVESALQWRYRAWSRRAIQQVLGEVSIVLKAFADYVDSLCGTPYSVDYDIWVLRINRALVQEGILRH
ncbi:hypothetical protein KP509_06G051100 [Ceratopteris richardii]|nr:hypothetical protein KP509_06G051100 [Ceratopteris richardii]